MKTHSDKYCHINVIYCSDYTEATEATYIRNSFGILISFAKIHHGMIVIKTNRILRSNLFSLPTWTLKIYSYRSISVMNLLACITEIQQEFLHYQLSFRIRFESGCQIMQSASRPHFLLKVN